MRVEKLKTVCLTSHCIQHSLQFMQLRNIQKIIINSRKRLYKCEKQYNDDYITTYNDRHDKISN